MILKRLIILIVFTVILLEGCIISFKNQWYGDDNAHILGYTPDSVLTFRTYIKKNKRVNNLIEYKFEFYLETKSDIYDNVDSISFSLYNSNNEFMFSSKVINDKKFHKYTIYDYCYNSDIYSYYNSKIIKDKLLYMEPIFYIKTKESKTKILKYPKKINLEKLPKGIFFWH